MFKDRYDAALQLAKKLEKYRNNGGIILAIPRGGVPIGYVVAKELKFPLEIILSKKIGHPLNPEFAIGSVSLQGAMINDNVMDVSLDYIQRESEQIHKKLKEKFSLYMGNRKSTDLKNKTVIIVDDGIATGSTILATVDSIKKSKPKEIIIAVPVSSLFAESKLSKVVDEFICLITPENFMGVGQFYDNFSQVSDEEVIQLLSDANKIKNVA
ncbi:MAG: phosphoribosyltransferase [Bacteroidetes bacterium]|nr:phosphoribosyltransferase [Bacteroidota bacterium]